MTMKKIILIILLLIACTVQAQYYGTTYAEKAYINNAYIDTLESNVYFKSDITGDTLTFNVAKIGNSTAYVLLNANGIELVDSATQWNDLVIPATLINPAGSPTPPTVDNKDGTYLFKADEITTVAFSFQIPHNYKTGTNIDFHIHAAKTTSASGTPLWRFKYRWVNIGDTATSFTGYDTLTIASLLTDGNLAGQHLIYDDEIIVSGVTGYGYPKTLSSILIVYLERTGTATSDNYEADMKLYSVDIHYQVKSFGSKNEYTD